MAAMRPGRPLRAPAPFGYVPLAEPTLPRRDPLFTQGHERLADGSLDGRLEGQIVALSPVHVGAGGIERTARVAPALAAQTPLVFPLVRAAGVPIIPGSALKGAIRGVVEAVTASCLAVRGDATRLLPPSLHPLRPCTRRDALCTTCRLFGAAGYQGRVRLDDAPLVGGETTVVYVPSLFAPRPGRGGVPRGRKFYQHGRLARGNVPVEAWAEGSAFRWRLDFRNLTRAELGLLMVALGLGEPPLWLKLGGYKPACLGSVRFVLTGLTLEDPAARYLSFDAEVASTAESDGSAAGEPNAAESSPGAPSPADTPDLTPYLGALTESGLLLPDRLQRLAAILRYPGDGDCPGGGY